MNGTIVASQLGARMHYAVPRIFSEAGALEYLYTDICAVQGFPRLLHGLPPGLRANAIRRLLGRVPAGVPHANIRTFPAMGAYHVIRRMRTIDPAELTRLSLVEASAFSRAVLRRGFGQAEGFYGIAGECLEQLRGAKARGLWCAVEQIIAPRDTVERLVAAARARHPAWAASLATDDHAAAFAARERAEWAVADIVICPSEFVRDTVIADGGPAEKCVVVPYGIDIDRFEVPDRPPHPMLRVLTVGAVGLRKGSPEVFAAARELGDSAEFRMVGSLADLPPGELVPTNMTLTGVVPRAEVARQFAWADVFLLPSVCEGSATVTYEALASGLPVIATPNTGSVMQHGTNGVIVEPGNVADIVAALQRLAEDPVLLRRWSASAVQRAGAFDIAAYGKRLMAALAALRVRTIAPQE